MGEIHDIAEKALDLIYSDKRKEAIKLMVGFVGFKMESDKKRASKYLDARITETIKIKGRVTKESLLFSISGTESKKQLNKGKFKD